MAMTKAEKNKKEKIKGGKMCCEICPDYNDCEMAGYLKENCCEECPDYEECMGQVKEDF
jgi:hypothetical protein